MSMDSETYFLRGVLGDAPSFYRHGSRGGVKNACGKY